MKYRDLVGGFIEEEQLKEVYGLDDAVLKEVYRAVYVSSDFIPLKVNVNKTEIKEMASHPYMKYSLAKKILAYRRQHGDFKAIGDLLNIHSLDSVTFIKLQPYLEL